MSSWRLCKHFDLTEVRAQSRYKVRPYELVNPTFKKRHDSRNHSGGNPGNYGKSHENDIGSDLFQMQQNMCFILLHAMEPFMAPLLSFVPAQAHVMYGLLLSPRYKELRQVDELWAAVHRDMSKEERKVACLRVIEQYEAGLIDLMVAAPLFGREEIVIGEEDTTPPGSCIHNTRAHTFCLIHIHT